MAPMNPLTPTIPEAEKSKRLPPNPTTTTTSTASPEARRVYGSKLREAFMAEGYRVMAEQDHALAEADMAAGFETLPPS